MKNDANLRRTQVSSQMKARQVAETRSMDSDVDLISTPAQVEIQQESAVRDEARGKSLDFQINTRQNRQRFLHQVQKDVVSSIKFYAVILAMVASVTFIIVLHPPGGLDDDGHLKVHESSIKGFIICMTSAFHLAVAGTLICMGCIAFMFPRTELGLNYDKQIINGKMPRNLKWASIVEIVAKFLLVVSLLLVVNAFRLSVELVMSRDR